MSIDQVLITLAGPCKPWKMSSIFFFIFFFQLKLEVCQDSVSAYTLPHLDFLPQFVQSEDDLTLDRLSCTLLKQRHLNGSESYILECLFIMQSVA